MPQDDFTGSAAGAPKPRETVYSGYSLTEPTLAGKYCILKAAGTFPITGIADISAHCGGKSRTLVLLNNDHLLRCNGTQPEIWGKFEKRQPVECSEMTPQQTFLIMKLTGILKPGPAPGADTHRPTAAP